MSCPVYSCRTSTSAKLARLASPKVLVKHAHDNPPLQASSFVSSMNVYGTKNARPSLRGLISTTFLQRIPQKACCANALDSLAHNTQTCGRKRKGPRCPAQPITKRQIVCTKRGFAYYSYLKPHAQTSPLPTHFARYE